MRLLLTYLKPYWKLVALALLLATINQVFSLLDPLIFRHVIDEYALRHDQYSRSEFFRGVTLLPGALPIEFTQERQIANGPTACRDWWRGTQGR